MNLTAIANPKASIGPTAVPADSVRLHIEDSGGSGRPVVLIHGWPLSAQAWEPQVSVLRAAGYRVVAYDRRGFGRSDKPESGYGYDTLADDLQRVMDQCDLQDVTLVGFSMGGGEVARYIARHGESRLHSVVFAAAVPPYLMKSADNPDGPLTPEKAQQKKQALEQDRSAYLRPVHHGPSSRPTVCCRSPRRSAARRSPCASSRRSMRRWPAWIRSPPPTSATT